MIRDRSIDLAPLIDGGGQEFGLRSGTENVAAIVGFGCAAELAQKELLERARHLLALQERLEQGLRSLAAVTLLAQDAQHRLPNTTLFAMEGISGDMLLMQLDEAGFAISSGSACASKTGEPSHVLQAMAVPEALAECVVRVSLGRQNKAADIDALINFLKGYTS